MNVGLTFIYWLTRFWWLIPPLSIAVFIVYLQMSRGIENVVCVHFKGGTRAYRKARVIGTNIRFHPHGKQRNVAPAVVHIDEEPETMVRGLKTLRVYDVVEGGGKTVNYYGGRDQLRDDVETIVKELKELNGGSEWDADVVGRVKAGLGELLGNFNFTQRSLRHERGDPQSTAAAASMSLFERFTTMVAANLPKSRSDYAFWILFMAVGVVIGFLAGSLMVKMGVF